MNQNTNTQKSIETLIKEREALKAHQKEISDAIKAQKKEERVKKAQNTCAVLEEVTTETEKSVKWILKDKSSVSDKDTIALLRKEGDKYVPEFPNGLPNVVPMFSGKEVGYFYWLYNKAIKAQGYKGDYEHFTYVKANK